MAAEVATGRGMLVGAGAAAVSGALGVVSLMEVLFLS